MHTLCYTHTLKYYRTPDVDSNPAYGTPLQATYHNPYYYEGTYPMTPLNRPPINPPLPPHSGQLGPPVMYRSESNASYIKMNSAAVKADTFNEFYEEGSKEEPLYERVGPSQWPSEYAEPREGHIYANT